MRNTFISISQNAVAATDYATGRYVSLMRRLVGPPCRSPDRAPPALSTSYRAHPRLYPLAHSLTRRHVGSWVEADISSKMGASRFDPGCVKTLAQPRPQAD